MLAGCHSAHTPVWGPRWARSLDDCGGVMPLFLSYSRASCSWEPHHRRMLLLHQHRMAKGCTGPCSGQPTFPAAILGDSTPPYVCPGS